MIYVTSDQGYFGELILDPEDERKAIQYKWFILDGYQNLPHAIIDNKLISICRFVLTTNNIELPKDHSITHLDGNKLNNKKENLKVAKYTSIYQN